MKGSYQVIVKNRRIQYKFTICRNITILKGDSATGKTTLIDMIQAFQNDSASSGVSIESKCPCVVLTSNNNSGIVKGNNIAQILQNPSDFIDSQKYFSWELFFTDLLKKSTHGTYLEYSKTKLNKAYLQDKESKTIIKQIPKIFN